MTYIIEDVSIRRAIEAFICESDVLYESVEVSIGNMIDPPEYTDYCKLCGAQEREHNPSCLLYPLWMCM